MKKVIVSKFKVKKKKPAYNQGFLEFVKWSEANGWTEGCDLVLVRVDPDGNYEPKNCKWVTQEEKEAKGYVE